ncbi:MAG: phospholipase C [Nitrososphaerales archaeon]
MTVVLLILLSGLPNIQSVVSATSNAPRTPINHIVIIMQENHSFDNYFGTFPGLAGGYGLNLTTCEPVNTTDLTKGCIHPYSADGNSNIQLFDLNHNWTTSHIAYDQGKMDAFVYAQLLSHHSNYAYSMSYYTSQTIPDYWDYASYYALDANFFSSTLAMTYPNRLYTIAGQSGGIIGGPAKYDLTFPTIVNELNASGISWKYYMGGWKMSTACQTFDKTVAKNSESRGWRPYWSVLPDFPAVQLSPSTCWRLQDTSHLMNDISSGNLPQVSWVIPQETVSEHPGPSSKFGPNSILDGQMYISSIVNAISSNPALWANTAIFITYDEFGGYYDNVAPQQVDGSGYGFRVPLTVISPYVAPGIYYGQSGKQQDLTALLATIEYNWGLGSLTNRDSTVGNLFYMFNFDQPARPPLILPTTSLATYPYNQCVSDNVCHVGTTTYSSSITPNVNPISNNQTLSNYFTSPIGNSTQDNYSSSDE